MLISDRITLINIVDSIMAIETYMIGINDYQNWANDSKNIDACLIRLLHIGEMVCKLSEEFTENHDQIEWYKIRGLRIIIAHYYLGVDNMEIWSMIKTKIPALNKYVSSIL